MKQDGLTGLEAAILLIAFVVVAAVFSYVVLGAGLFTSKPSSPEGRVVAVGPDASYIDYGNGVYYFRSNINDFDGTRFGYAFSKWRESHRGTAIYAVVPNACVNGDTCGFYVIT